jgi:hypothetical protein
MVNAEQRNGFPQTRRPKFPFPMPCHGVGILFINKMDFQICDLCSRRGAKSWKTHVCREIAGFLQERPACL